MTTSLLTGVLQRQPKVPSYEKCSETGKPHINLKIENGRQRAIDYVQVTIRALKGDPDAPSADPAYRSGLRRHFRGPSAADRATLRENYEKILGILKSASSIRCASTKDEVDKCEARGELFGFVIKGGQTIIVCSNITEESIRCRAIGLIHEAAHIVNIGAGTTHPTRRGMGEYPWPQVRKEPSAAETAATRLDNPDAYGYFAAHVWREVDTMCPPPLVLNEVITVEGKAP
jgi:hypothetical protein